MTTCHAIGCCAVLTALWLSPWSLGATALDSLAIPEKVNNSVVQILVDDGSGSGFVLNSGGYVATNHHVVDGSATFRVKHGNRIAGADLIWVSEPLDLAVIRTGLAGLDPVALALALPSDGLPVYAAGFPGFADVVSATETAQATYTNGIVSRTFLGTWNRSETLRIVQHNAQINPGNSGGPLIDACGRVIGVNSAGPSVTIQGQRINAPTGVGFASFIQELAVKLDSIPIPYESVSDSCESAIASGSAVSAEQIEDLRRQLEEQDRIIEEFEQRRLEQDAGQRAEAQAERDELRVQLQEALATAQTKRGELQEQLQGAMAALAAQAETNSQREAELAGLREEFTGRWLFTMLIAGGAVLVFAVIAFFAFASFRRTVIQTAARVRNSASRVVPSRRSHARGSPVHDSKQAAGQRIRIGRGRDMDVTLNSTKVSRFHAELEITGRGYQLTDQDSTNGTKVFRDERWQRIRQQFVEPNERLELGDHRTTASEIERMTARPGQGSGNKQPGKVGADDRPAGPVKRNRRTGEIVRD